MKAQKIISAVLAFSLAMGINAQMATKENYLIGDINSHWAPVSAWPAQAIPTAAALTAHPWGASSPSPLTPLSRTAPRSLPPASPGRSPPGSLGLRPHRPATDRRVLVSGPRVPSQVLEKMQPKRTQNQTARASPPSPVPGTRLHPSTWPRRGPMGSQD